MKSASNLRLSLHTLNTGICFALRDVWRPKFKTGTASSAAHCHIPTQSQPLINPRRQTSHKRVSQEPFKLSEPYRFPFLLDRPLLLPVGLFDVGGVDCVD